MWMRFAYVHARPMGTKIERHSQSARTMVT